MISSLFIFLLAGLTHGVSGFYPGRLLGLSFIAGIWKIAIDEMMIGFRFLGAQQDQNEQTLSFQTKQLTCSSI